MKHFEDQNSLSDHKTVRGSSNREAIASKSYQSPVVHCMIVPFIENDFRRQVVRSATHRPNKSSVHRCCHEELRPEVLPGTA